MEKSRFELWARKQQEINTDPQRRCYWGVHARSEMVWTEWYYLYYVSSEDAAKQSLETWRAANPTHEYKIIEAVIPS